VRRDPGRRCPARGPAASAFGGQQPGPKLLGAGPDREHSGVACRIRVNDTRKGQLDLELHGGRSIDGLGARIGQRLLALTAAIWHNRATGQPVTRSLIAYDH